MKSIVKLVFTAAVVLIFASRSEAQNMKSTSTQVPPKKAIQSSQGNFVDQNGDGICDNRAIYGNKPGVRCRNTQGYHNRNGHGQGNVQRTCYRRK